MKKLFLIFSLLFSAASSAHVINISDTVVDMPLPDGYCVLDHRTPFYRFNETALGSSVKLLLIASDCQSVKDVASGREKTLKHYIAMEQVGIKKRFIRFTFGDMFYVNLIRSFRLKDLSKYEHRINEKLEEQNVVLRNIQANLAASDESSLTYRASANLTGFDKKVKVNLNAVTFLYRELPFALHTYDENADENTLKKSMKELMDLKGRIK